MRARCWPPEVRRVLIARQLRSRDDAIRRMRCKAAGLPARRRSSTAQTTPPRTHPDRLSMQDWVGRAENLSIAGTSGHQQDPVRRSAHAQGRRRGPAGLLVHAGVTHVRGARPRHSRRFWPTTSPDHPELGSPVIDGIGVLARRGSPPPRRCTASSARPTNAAASPCDHQPEPPWDSTRSCPRRSPQPPLPAPAPGLTPRAPHYA
jgi:hypothetical protein